VLFLPRFWRFGGDEFLEARIIPKGIEHRIEPERARPNSSTRARELALNGAQIHLLMEGLKNRLWNAVKSCVKRC